MDGDDSQKTYPRPGIDPYAGRSMKITAISANTITVNAGASRTNQYFTPSAAFTYDPSNRRHDCHCWTTWSWCWT